MDPNVQNDITDEFIVGLDRELMPNFGVGISYIWRQYHDFQDAFRSVTSDTYSPVAFSRACGNALCDQATYSGVYFQRAVALPAGTTLRNYGAYRDYNGIDITARKRFSHRWLMNSSFAWNHTKINYPSPNDYSTSADPTNFALVDGRDSSGLNGARWVLKLSGMYALPWRMSASAFFNAREGFQFNRTIQSPNRTGAGGTVNVFIEEQGASHYPTFQELDAHWDKSIPLVGVRKVTLNVDGFNLLNAATVLDRTTRQDTARANFVNTILAPRVFRFGVKLAF